MIVLIFFPFCLAGNVFCQVAQGPDNLKSVFKLVVGVKQQVLACIWVSGKLQSPGYRPPQSTQHSPGVITCFLWYPPL